MKNKKEGQESVVDVHFMYGSCGKAHWEGDIWQTQDRNDWVSHVDIRGKSVSGTEESKVKGTEGGRCVECLKNSKDTDVAGGTKWASQNSWWWGGRDHKGSDYPRPWRSLLGYWYLFEWELKPWLLVFKRIYSGVKAAGRLSGKPIGKFWN